MMVDETACGKPQRNRRSDFFISLVIGIPAFLMLLVRGYSRRTLGGQLNADDILMLACGVSDCNDRGMGNHSNRYNCDQITYIVMHALIQLRKQSPADPLLCCC